MKNIARKQSTMKHYSIKLSSNQWSIADEYADKEP